MRNIISYIRSRWHPLHMLRKHRRCRAFLKAIDWTACVNVGLRQPIHVKVLNHAPFYLLRRKLDPELRRLYGTLIKGVDKDSVIFDIGSNIGIYSWIALDSRPDLTMVSVEPDPALVRLIAKTSERWRPRAHHIIEMAVTDGVGRREFEVDETTTATGQLVRADGSRSFQETHFGSRGKIISVEAITIDGLVARFGVPALIKIDVEGHEVSALNGADKLFKVARPILLVESFPPKSDQTREILTGLGYHLVDAQSYENASRSTTDFAAIPKDLWEQRIGEEIRRLAIGPLELMP